MELKRGKLSNSEMQYIRDNIDQLSIEDIAANINRTVEPVERFLREHNIVTSTTSAQEADYMEWRDRLKRKAYWPELIQQLSKEELSYFEKNWIAIMADLHGDVRYSEELQIKQWLTLEILANRSMKERAKHLVQLAEAEKYLEAQRQMSPDLREDYARAQDDLLSLRASIQGYTTEHAKLLDKIQAITKDLKATRDQRIKRLDDYKSSFVGWIRMLEDEKLREQEGEKIELMRLAKDHTKKRLSEYHTFVDGKIDRPFLVPELIENEEDEETNNEDE